MTLVGAETQTLPFRVVTVRSITGVSVTVTSAVSTVPSGTLFSGITAPSIVAVFPGFSWKSL